MDILDRHLIKTTYRNTFVVVGKILKTWFKTGIPCLFRKITGTCFQINCEK